MATPRSAKTLPLLPSTSISFKRLFRLLLVIHVAAMRDGKHQHAICLVVDPINDAPIANAVTQMAGEFARQAFDIVVPARLALSLR